MSQFQRVFRTNSEGVKLCTMKEIVDLSGTDLLRFEFRQQIIEGKLEEVLSVEMKPSLKADEIARKGVVTFRGRRHVVYRKLVSTKLPHPVIHFTLVDVGRAAL